MTISINDLTFNIIIFKLHILKIEKWNGSNTIFPILSTFY